jgi:hypothetical protein
MTLENNGPIKTYYPRKTCLSKINKTFFQLQKKKKKSKNITTRHTNSMTCDGAIEET